MLKFLFSFESFFVLRIFSYQYKNGFDVFFSPDITVLLTVALIPWALVIYGKNKIKPEWRTPTVLTFLGMGLWFVVSSFWSPSPAYKVEKTFCYALYTIPGFLVGYGVVAQDPARLKRLMKAFLVFGALVLLETYHLFFVNGLSTISPVFNTNYLVTGQTLGPGRLVLLSYGYFERAAPLSKTSATAVIKPTVWMGPIFSGSLFFYALVNLGGRGPVIATAVSLAVFYGVRCWLAPSFKPTAYFAIFGIFCLFISLALNNIFDHTGSHFYQPAAPLLGGQMDEAIRDRRTYYQSAISVFLNHPIIGCGFGGWPITSGLGEADLHLYPHNIFLEVLSETGLVGFTSLIAFLCFSVRHLSLGFLFSATERASLVLLTVFAFINAQKINAQKTGDLHDNLLLFMGLSLWAGIKRGRRDGAHHT